MKLDDRLNWVEDDLGQQQTDRLLVLERQIYVTDWLAMAVSFIAGAFSISLLVIIFGGHQ